MARTPEPVDDGRRSIGDVKSELEILSQIVLLLAPLTKDERVRVLRFVRDKFGIYVGDD